MECSGMLLALLLAASAGQPAAAEKNLEPLDAKGCKWLKVFDDPKGTTAPWAYGFNSGAWDHGRNRWYSLNPGGSNGLVWTYDAASNTWTKGKGLANKEDGPGTVAHNISGIYDSHNDLLWLSAGAPQPNPGSYHWKVTDDKWTRWAPKFSGPSADPLAGFDPKGKAIYVVGGWNDLGGGVYKLPVDPMPADASAWKVLAKGEGPKLNVSPLTRETNCRGGWDRARNELWLIDFAGDYWTFSPVREAWARKETRGAKPPPDTVYGLRGTQVIGFAPKDMNKNAPILETYLLDTVSGVWAAGPSKATGDVMPPATSYYSTINMGDPEATFLVGTGMTSLWRLVKDNR